MIKVTTHEAKTQLSKLLAQVRKGEEVIICRGNQPAARLVDFDPKQRLRERRPRVGVVTTPQVRWSDDAFEPLDDDALREWGL